MLFSWFPTLMLAVEASHVINARLLKVAAGGEDAATECQLMVTEKIDAFFEAGSIVASGGSIAEVVGNYRKHIAANNTRLRPAYGSRA